LIICPFVRRSPRQQDDPIAAALVVLLVVNAVRGRRGEAVDATAGDLRDEPDHRVGRTRYDAGSER
jgi:hypothetical protein